jgi:hypothetical protein
MKMCPDPLFFTDSPQTRHGGIVVCGLNWGYDPPQYPEHHDESCDAKWQPPTFYQDDRFRKAMTKWLAVWGHDPRDDKVFDSVLLVTNVFYNTTHGSGNLKASGQDWEHAIRRLITAAQNINASGILIATRLAFPYVDRQLRGRDSTFRWSDAGGNWCMGMCGEMEIAVGPHYRARGGLGSDAAVLAAKPKMEAWLDRAMTRAMSFRK